MHLAQDTQWDLQRSMENSNPPLGLEGTGGDGEQAEEFSFNATLEFLNKSLLCFYANSQELRIQPKAPAKVVWLFYYHHIYY